VSESDKMCIHHIPWDDFCIACDEIASHEEEEAAEVHEEDASVIEILLSHAPLTGGERHDLESVIEEDEFKRVDRERFQQIVNQHIHILHAHQK
jgi:hypothetical protein